MANQFTKEKEIGGVKYVAQFNGFEFMYRVMDESHVDNDSSNISMLKLGKRILKDVIVEPKDLKMDDFTDRDTLNEVIAFGMEVMQGKFRDTNEVSAEDSGKK